MSAAHVYLDPPQSPDPRDDPATVAEVLTLAIGRHMAVHGVVASPEQVAAIAANVAYAVVEMGRR